MERKSIPGNWNTIVSPVPNNWDRPLLTLSVVKHLALKSEADPPLVSIPSPKLTNYRTSSSPNVYVVDEVVTHEGVGRVTCEGPPPNTSVVGNNSNNR